jgi:hypothetical protein
MPIRFVDLASDHEYLTLTGQRHVAEVTWRATFHFGR